MPAFVPYFAAFIFVLFGVGFYFALISFRNASDKDRTAGEPPLKK